MFGAHLRSLLLSLTFTTWFVAVERWYGMQGQEARLGSSFFPYQKKFRRIYDSYMLFDDEEKEEEKEINFFDDGKGPEVEGGRDPLAGGSCTVPLA